MRGADGQYNVEDASEDNCSYQKKSGLLATPRNVYSLVMKTFNDMSENEVKFRKAIDV